MSTAQVLLVDDSSFMRIVLQDMLADHRQLAVVDTAENGKDALEKVMKLSPDVVLLDLTMKDYDGLYAIKEIMSQKPTPIVVLSSIRSSDPGKVIEALQLGAVDFLDKPSGMIQGKIREIEAEIVQKLTTAARSKLGNSFEMLKKSKNQYEHTFPRDIPYDMVAIGASTGGTGAIEYILCNLPSNFPIPIVIAQHMPEEFLISFAQRLDGLCPLRVCLAKETQSLERGKAYILPGHTNTGISKKSEQAKPRFETLTETFSEYNHPSVDGLFKSVAHTYGSRSILVLLTGMGKDGALGMKEAHQQGAYTVAQDKESSVVYGMPKAAVDLGAVRRSIPLREIPGFIVSALS